MLGSLETLLNDFQNDFKNNTEAKIPTWLKNWPNELLQVTTFESAQDKNDLGQWFHSIKKIGEGSFGIVLSAKLREARYGLPIDPTKRKAKCTREAFAVRKTSIMSEGL